MVLVVETAADVIVFLVSLFLLVYLYRFSAVFKGGTLSKAFVYFVVAMVIACVAFGARIFFDLYSVDADALMVPVRDAGTTVILVVLAFGLRKATAIWPRSG